MSWESLPLLKSSFFTNLEVSTISHLLKTGDYWSESLMPVGLWENSAIIATSDPSYKVPDMGVPCILVRAEKTDLKKLYQSAFSQNAEPIAESKISAASVSPVIGELEAPVVPNIPDFQIPSMPIEEEVSPASAEPIPEINLAIPDVPDVNIDFSGLNTTEENHTPPPVVTETEEVTKRFVTPEAPVAVVNNVVAMPTASNTSAPASDWDIQPFLKDFDKVMFLKWMGTHLEIANWLGPWEINPHASKKIDISSNSIFKIPLKSTYPYHGHVIGNPVNDSFFQNFNAGRTPEHVTIFPVYSDDNFCGEVVCFTTKAKGEKINLDSYDQHLHKAQKAS